MSMYEKLTSLGDADMIPCEEALKVVQEYLDGELDEASARSVRKHFDACGRCYPHLDFEKAYRDAVCRAVKRETVPSDLRAKVAALIAEADGKADPR